MSARVEYESLLPDDKRLEAQEDRRERIKLYVGECRKIERNMFKVTLTMRTLTILGVLFAVLTMLIYLNR